MAVLLVDQASKAFVVNNNFSYHLNPAGIFGLFGNLGFLSEFIVYIIVIVIAFYSFKTQKHSPLEVLAYGLLLGGGLGNLVDRIRLNGVIDFLELTSKVTNGSIKFNIADLSLTSAVIIMLFKGANQNRKS